MGTALPEPPLTSVGAAAKLLVVEAVSKRYGAVQALDGVTLRLGTGEVHGLCGHNGAGKSTLVKVITGIVKPDLGSIFIDGQLVSLRSPLDAQAHGIALVDQELSLPLDLSVEDNLFLGGLGVARLRHPRILRRRAVELLAAVGLDGLDPRTRAGQLTLGERQLVEVARLLGREARVLVLDEPTATLSRADSERVFALVRDLVRRGKSVIYVSHRLDEVLSLADQISVLRDGRCEATRRASDIAHRHELIRLMLGEDLPAAERPVAAECASGGEIEIRGLTVPPVVKAVDLTAHSGQIIGLTGQVGSGTSEVLRAIAGLSPEARGTVRVGGRLVPLRSPTRAFRAGIAFGSSDRKGEGLFIRKSVELNLTVPQLGALSRIGFLVRRRLVRAAAQAAALAGVDLGRLRSAVGQLSGGNQQKVLVGRNLGRNDVRLLVLDEPTRGVDVAGRAEIHAVIREAARAGTAVIFASPELDEILDLADVVVTMFEGRVVAVRARAEATAENVSADMTMSAEHDAAPAAGGRG